MTQFDFVQDAFDSGYPIIVMKDGLWGLIDKHENVLIEPKYDCIEPFIHGFAMVKKNGLYGFVNEKGLEIVSPKYAHAEPFSFRKIAIVERGLNYGIIDEDGKEHFFNNCYNIQKTNSHILFICDKRGEWHSYNTKTKTLYKLYIHNFYELGDHYVITNNKNLIGLLNPDGDIAIECKYTSITQLNEWMYALYDKANDCFVYNVHDNSFNYVGAIHVHSVVQSKNEFYLTYTDRDGKIRFINTTNYMEVPGKYCDKIIENDLGLLKVEIAGKVGFIYL